jgi:nitrile hydratase
MDGVHDLGGMQGFGPVEREENEPVFHAAWEAAVLAIQHASRARGLFNIDEFRHGIERMAPAHYLRATYYEKWLEGITRLLVEKGVVGVEELATRRVFFEGKPDASAAAALPGPPPARGASRPASLMDFIRETGATPRFAPGDAVRTREMHPHGHTRLPRYARGKRGVVHGCHGIHVFPDTNAHGRGEQPQPLYSVRFDARELWGESAEPNQAVHIDLWESYLLPGR